MALSCTLLVSLPPVLSSPACLLSPSYLSLSLSPPLTTSCTPMIFLLFSSCFQCLCVLYLYLCSHCLSVVIVYLFLSLACFLLHVFIIILLSFFRVQSGLPFSVYILHLLRVSSVCLVCKYGFPSGPFLSFNIHLDFLCPFLRLGRVRSHLFQ